MHMSGRAGWSAYQLGVLKVSPGVALCRSAAGKEAEVGKMLADAAIKAGIKHFIWTTLPDTNAESDGKWPCSMFSEKAKVRIAH